MSEIAEYVEYYLQELRGRGWENAYFSLLGTDEASVPLLIKACRDEKSLGIRAVLLNIIWQHRAPAALDFLAEALRDREPKIWKEALDGFVAIDDPAGIALLLTEKERLLTQCPNETTRLEWIDEAIEQLHGSSNQ